MGVDSNRGLWRARISVNRHRVELGRFATEVEARAVYADAVQRLAPGRVRAPRPASDPRDRFASKTAIGPNGCVLWTGAKDKDGYGKFQLNGGGKQTHVRAHRFAFFAANGRWPSDQALHSCDTPSCVNPEHLSDGSQSENLVQCAVRGRRTSIRMTTELVRHVRDRHADGESVTDIANELGINRATLFAVVHRRTWRHVA